jgi:2-methylcitrate dehydratase PrpD
LASRVELYVDAEIQAMYPRYAIKVEVHLGKGTKLKTMLLDAHGTPIDPCSEDEAKQKFRCLASVSCDNHVIDSILDIVERIEQLPSVTPLSAALRGSV